LFIEEGKKQKLDIIYRILWWEMENASGCSDSICSVWGFISYCAIYICRNIQGIFLYARSFTHILCVISLPFTYIMTC